MTTLAATVQYGLYDRVRMYSEQLAIGRSGRYWYVLDMTGDRAAMLGRAYEARWEAQAEAGRRCMTGDYR